MDKTIRFNVSPEEQQAETYRYWQSVPVWERIQATFDLSVSAYSFKKQVSDAVTSREGLSRSADRAEQAGS